MRIISNIDGTVTYKISSLPNYIVFPARPPRRRRVRHKFRRLGRSLSEVATAAQVSA